MHAEAILETGKNICITDINLKNLSKLYKSLKKKFPKNEIIYKKLDVTNESKVKKFFKSIRNKYFVSILINNAIDFKIKKI